MDPERKRNARPKKFQSATSERESHGAQSASLKSGLRPLKRKRLLFFARRGDSLAGHD
jgi:hypothetical protein